MELVKDINTPVRSFYERMPYPAPFTSLDEHRDLYKNPDRRRAHFHMIWPTEALRGNQEILIAGCGTSQAARYALREPDARITAIDISETSLRYTRHLQRQYNLENLDLHHLPIEDVGALGQTFDHIVCTGVLHHLPDPDRGLAALRDVLRPQGAMHLMVYAPYGRAGVYMMQEYCRLLASARRSTICEISAPHWNRFRPIIRYPGCSAAQRISGTPTRWPTRCFIPWIAPTPSRSCWRGSGEVECRLAGGSSRLPTFHTAEQWPGALTRRVSPRSHRHCSMLPSSSFGDRWSRTT
jgi:SAM-dependent methyltransferase